MTVQKMVGLNIDAVTYLAHSLVRSRIGGIVFNKN